MSTLNTLLKKKKKKRNEKRKKEKCLPDMTQLEKHCLKHAILFGPHSQPWRTIIYKGKYFVILFLVLLSRFIISSRCCTRPTGLSIQLISTQGVMNTGYLMFNWSINAHPSHPISKSVKQKGTVPSYKTMRG